MRCGYCWLDGHTKTTCPKRIRYIEEYPESWEARQFKDSRERKQKKNQRCSYCEETGHTRRSCTHFKFDVDTLTKANMSWRDKMADHMQEIGFAPGTLLETTGKWWVDGEYQTGARLVMVSSVDWTRLHFGAIIRGRISRDTLRAITGTFIDGQSSDYDHARCWIPLPHVEPLTRTQRDWENRADDIDAHYSSQSWKIVSPISKKAVDASIDTKFFEAESCKKVVMEHMNDDPYSNNASKKRPRSGVNMNEFSWIEKENN